MFDFIAKDTNEGNVSEEYINSLEDKLGIEFPSVLREFYLSHNAAILKEIYFEMVIQKQHVDFHVDFIIPLKYGNVTVEGTLEFTRGNEYIPKTFIPFAEEISGDDFYWDSVTEKVYYISMGNVENPIPICNSVEEFFQILSAACVKKDDKGGKPGSKSFLSLFKRGKRGD